MSGAWSRQERMTALVIAAAQSLQGREVGDRVAEASTITDDQARQIGFKALRDAVRDDEPSVVVVLLRMLTSPALAEPEGARQVFVLPVGGAA
ncbi:hypothetical protein ACQEU3_47240 [Spirillospora sp. CA-253888]